MRFLPHLFLLAILGLLVAILVGCTSGLKARPIEETPPFSEWTAGKQVRLILGNCERTHDLYASQLGSVDCRYDYPRSMTLIFPNRGIREEAMETVLKFYRGWCVGIQGLTGTVPDFISVFVEEETARIQHCEFLTARGETR